MTDGPAILASLRAVQTLHEQTATLLRTADEYLTQDVGLRSTRTYRAAGEGSTSLKEPRRWIPSYVARFFRTADPTVLAFATVLLVDHPGDRYARPFEEPLVAAGWVRFPAEPPKNYWWWGKMPHWTDHPRDGTLSRSVADGQPDRFGASEQRCLTLPLIEITGTLELIERVLDPMVDSLPDSAGAQRA